MSADTPPTPPRGKMTWPDVASLAIFAAVILGTIWMFTH